MIEGINSSIATASLLRPIVEQETNARGQSASVEPVQRLPQAPYVSPYLFVDNANNKVILQIRDSESGDVVRQIPSDSQIRAYSKAVERPVPIKLEPVQENGTSSGAGPDVLESSVSSLHPDISRNVAEPSSDSSDDSLGPAASVLITA